MNAGPPKFTAPGVGRLLSPMRLMSPPFKCSAGSIFSSAEVDSASGNLKESKAEASGTVPEVPFKSPNRIFLARNWCDSANCLACLIPERPTGSSVPPVFGEFGLVVVAELHLGELGCITWILLGDVGAEAAT